MDDALNLCWTKPHWTRHLPTVTHLTLISTSIQNLVPFHSVSRENIIRQYILRKTYRQTDVSLVLAITILQNRRSLRRDSCTHADLRPQRTPVSRILLKDSLVPEHMSSLQPRTRMDFASFQSLRAQPAQSSMKFRILTPPSALTWTWWDVRCKYQALETMKTTKNWNWTLKVYIYSPSGDQVEQLFLRRVAATQT